jgi:hypothetical protein
MIRLYTFYTESHRQLLEEWFLPTIQDPLVVVVTKADQVTATGSFTDIGFGRTMAQKVEVIRQALRTTREGEWFIYSDCDVQFFRPMLPRLMELMTPDLDAVFQSDRVDGLELCAGFFACRNNARTRGFWDQVAKEMEDPAVDNDQPVVNQNKHLIGFSVLPPEFFGAGTLDSDRPGDSLWAPGRKLTVPPRIIMHHANWCLGLEHKVAQLIHVRKTQEEPPL